MGKNQESKAGVIITKYEAMIGDINVDENGEFQYMLRYKTYNNHFFWFVSALRSGVYMELKQNNYLILL